MSNARTAAEAMREAIARSVDRIGDESPEEWDLLSIVAAIRAVPLPDPAPDPRDAAMKLARDGLTAMIAEWDKMTRYGSPLARAANENLRVARAVLATLDAAMKLQEPVDRHQR